MRRRGAVLAAVLLCGLLALPLGGGGKERAARYVRQNREELEQLVEALAEGGDVPASYNGWSISYCADTGMAAFETGASGLAPSSAYWGFYYSPENIPLPVMGAEEAAYAPSGDGWRWEEPEGDNWAYTEALAENWFWYEMHF